LIAENIITKGEYVLFTDLDSLNNIKKFLNEYLVKKGYVPEDLNNIYYIDRFFSMNYILSMPSTELSFWLKLKKTFKNITSDEIKNKQYFKNLANKRKEVPFIIKIILSLKHINKKRVIAIEITSTPVIYYQITQLKINKYLDSQDYSLIRYENREFIKEIMGAISANCVSEPNLLNDYIKSEVSKKLRLYKFNKIANLLDDGIQKLEMGENSTPNLIGVIENFLFELVSQLNITPEKLHNPEKNIFKLKKAGYLNDKLEATVKEVLFKGVYLKLKDLDHKKEHIDNIDLNGYYGITESIINYLLDKILKYNIKSNPIIDKDNVE
jgi:hypothetical protein